jgi:TPR repeat protein
MLKAGWHYANGLGTQRDAATAEEYYRHALCAGSRKATIRYASLLFQRGAHDKGPSTLADGVQNGFIPAHFWLAWFHYKRAPTARTAREVRHLLVTAAEAGHPGAALLLARWTAFGKFGLRKIPDGIRMIFAVVKSFRVNESAGLHRAAPAAT